MFDPSSFANHTPLAHADTSRDVLPREGTSQCSKQKINIKCPKSVFGVANTRCNKCCYTTWHGVKQILNVCLWKIIPFCLYGQQKFVAAGRGSRARCRPTVLNRRHIR
ncbi:hypothetical protein TNCV_1545031 [Trichonephila clavipes]|nr:hypothetical protein TNCV_1545031 [Trichonephila clavipes]